MALRLLRLPEVVDRTGSNIKKIYQDMNAGTFPKSVPIGERSVGWVESEIEDWIKAKIAARDEGAARRNKPGPGRGRRGASQPPVAA